jgi:hypothetical protein
MFQSMMHPLHHDGHAEIRNVKNLCRKVKPKGMNDIDFIYTYTLLVVREPG